MLVADLYLGLIAALRARVPALRAVLISAGEVAQGKLDRREEATPRDRVFLWRSVARGPEAVIASETVPERANLASRLFWHNLADAGAA